MEFYEKIWEFPKQYTKNKSKPIRILLELVSVVVRISICVPLLIGFCVWFIVGEIVEWYNNI